MKKGSRRRNDQESDESRRLDRRSVLRGTVGAVTAVSMNTGANAAAQSTDGTGGDATQLDPVGSAGDTSPGESQDGLDSPGTIIVGGTLILVTILYVLFRLDTDQSSSRPVDDTVVWDNPKFNEHMEIARKQFQTGSYRRAISAVQTAVQTAESAKARANQRGDDTTTISRALSAARDLNEEIVSERNSYDDTVTHLGQIDQELQDLRNQVDTTTDRSAHTADEEPGHPTAGTLLERFDETAERLDQATQTISEQEFDDLALDGDRLKERATGLRKQLLTQLVRAAPSEEVTVSTGGVEVTKRLSADDSSAPSVVYDIRVVQNEPTTIRMADTVPDTVDTADIVFSDEHAGEHWRVADDGTIVFEREADGNRSLSTAYEIHSTDSSDMTAYLTEPDLC